MNVLKRFLSCVCDIIPATNNPTDEEFIWVHGFGDVSPWLPAPIFWAGWGCEGDMWWRTAVHLLESQKQKRDFKRSGDMVWIDPENVF